MSWQSLQVSLHQQRHQHAVLMHLCQRLMLQLFGPSEQLGFPACRALHFTQHGASSWRDMVTDIFVQNSWTTI